MYIGLFAIVLALVVIPIVYFARRKDNKDKKKPPHKCDHCDHH